MKLLQIDSSVLGESSVTRQLTAAIVARWQAEVRGLDVQVRDLEQDPLPHLSGAILSGRDDIAAARGATVLEQFLAADVVVIGAPMYNFGLPSDRKSTRLNSSHVKISYAVFCLKKKKKKNQNHK